MLEQILTTTEHALAERDELRVKVAAADTILRYVASRMREEKQATGSDLQDAYVEILAVIEVLK